MVDIKYNAFERHAQTVIVLLLTALLLWVGNTVQQMSVVIATLEVEVKYLRTSPEVKSGQLVLIEDRLQAIELQLAGLSAIKNNRNIGEQHE